MRIPNILTYSILLGPTTARLSPNSHPEPPTATLASSPNAHGRNQSKRTVIRGRHLLGFNQDIFLGIPYADEPVRFGPSALKTTYSSSSSGAKTRPGKDGDNQDVVLDATTYGLDCPAYGSDTRELVEMGIVSIGEDCLRLNIIRPCLDNSEDGFGGKMENEVEDGGVGLPVLLWIYGGGWQQGATADPR